MIQSSKSLLLISLSVCSLAAAACSPTVAQRGNLIEDYQLAEIKVNESTRSDVLRTIGSPTTQSTFDPDVWYYIGQEMEKRGILDPEVKKYLEEENLYTKLQMKDTEQLQKKLFFF